MSKNNLGKVIITPRGLWSETEEYKCLDVVYALDASYLAKKDNQGVSTTDTSVWQPLAGRGPAGTGNVTVLENGLQTGKKYLFVPAANNSTEGIFEEYIPSTFTQQQSDWDQKQTDQPDFIKNKPSLFSGDYNDLQNKPFISDKTSDLENDTSFITQMEVEEQYQSKEVGKGLSTNDYTTPEKNKLEGIESGAQRNKPIVHKSITLEPENWEQYGDIWRARVPISGTDSEIMGDNSENIDGGSDISTINIWEKAGALNVIVDSNVVGYFYAYCKKQPAGSINYKYSIRR